MNGIEFGKRFLVLNFFLILFCFCGFIFGVCFKCPSSLCLHIKNLMSFESGVKAMIKDRLTNKVITSNYLVRSLKSKVVNLTGKSLERGIYKKGDTLLTMPVLPEKHQIIEDCLEIGKFCNSVKATPYFLILPTKFQLNGGFTVSKNYDSYENDLINFFNFKLNDKGIYLQNNFFSAYSKNFNFFYRTDSSLNSFGNFLVYRSVLEQMNMRPFNVNFFKVKTYSNIFYGNLFSENFVDFVKPDTIDLFEASDDILGNKICNIADNIKVVQIDSDLGCSYRNSVFDLKKLCGYDKNKVFFGDSSPIKIVETGLKDAERILIFSDGSVDGLMQFLALHFEKLVVVNLHELSTNGGDLKVFLNRFMYEHAIANFDKVLFLYGIESLKYSKIFRRLAYFYKARG